MDILDLAVPAYEVRIADQDVCVYMQTEVLAGGRHPHSFQKALDAFRTNFRKRRHAGSQSLGRIVELDIAQSEIDRPLAEIAAYHLEQMQVDAGRFADLFNDYGWKLRQLPNHPAHILSIGCGSGVELAFLRAKFPSAGITALDYDLRIGGGPRTLELLNVEFFQGDIFDSARLLQTQGRRFDLIFSNHVIEHFFEPDRAIANLAQLLRKDGMFSAGVPLDAYPFADLLEKFSAEPASIHGLDLNWLDLRHPWKTNEADLAATLLESDLGKVTLYRRTNSANNSKSSIDLSLSECRDRERRSRVLYNVLIQPIVGTMKVLFGLNPPRRLARLVFALDRRIWFGRYRIKLDTQPEVFVTAIKSSDK